MDRMREQMAAAGIAPTAKTMTVMMKYYGEKRDYASVLRLYHTMLAEGANGWRTGGCWLDGMCGRGV